LGQKGGDERPRGEGGIGSRKPLAFGAVCEIEPKGGGGSVKKKKRRVRTGKKEMIPFYNSGRKKVRFKGGLANYT